MHEDGMVGTTANNANLNLRGRVPACKSVETIERLPGIEVINGTLTIDLKYVWIERYVT